MRARSIKPGIFKNELLGTADPLFAQIFAGLWCLADREGRLEDRPLRIHVEINPYRPSASTVQALDWLVLHLFVIRYEAAGVKYLAIPNFRAHQQPHIKEPPSKIPAPSNQGDVAAPYKHSASTGVAALTPDSGLLTPDSPFPIPKVRRAAAAPLAEPVEFVELQSLYPRRAGSQRWPDALKAIHARLAEGSTWHEILNGARRYAEFIRAIGKERTEFVLQAATFCGKGREYQNLWEPPPERENAMDEIMRRAGRLPATAPRYDSTVIEHDDPIRISG